MVTRYGMSKDFGMTALETVNNRYLSGDSSLICSPETSAKIDVEVIEKINTAHEKAKNILSENIDKLHELADCIMEKETITGLELIDILNRKKRIEA